MASRKFQSAPGLQAGGNGAIGGGRQSNSMFQSAPGPQAGGNTNLSKAEQGSASFNPPPARRPGETHRPRERSLGPAPFQSAPGPQAFELELARLFQSAPGPQAGGNITYGIFATAVSCFNPPPARRPGETAHIAAAIWGVTEFQSAPGPQAGGNEAVGRGPTWAVLFQSAPGPQAGGNINAHENARNVWRFNPPPARRPGETFPLAAG